MKLTHSISALALIAFNGANVFANCTDATIADCGKFEILSTICYAENGRATEPVVSAVFKDGKPEREFSRKQYDDLDVYTADVSPNERILVNLTSQFDAHMHRVWHYSTYSIVEGGVKTIAKDCALTPKPEFKAKAVEPKQDAEAKK